MPTHKISVKECNKISKYKDLKIEIEKMWHLKTTTLPIIVGAIQKRTDKHINKKLGSPVLMKYKKLHFVELLISLGKYYQCD